MYDYPQQPDGMQPRTAGMLLALLRLAWDERRPRWLRGRLASADLWMLSSAPLWVAALADKRLQAAVAPAAFLVLAGSVLPLRAGLHKIGMRFASDGNSPPVFRVRWAIKGQQWRNVVGGELVH